MRSATSTCSRRAPTPRERGPRSREGNAPPPDPAAGSRGPDGPPGAAGRVVRGYYLASPLFAVVDFALGAPIRIAALARPGWRLAYYAFALACGLLARRKPEWTPLIGMVESAFNLLLLVLSVLVPIFTLPARIAEGAEVVLPFGPAELGNVVLSGGVLILSFYRQQSRVVTGIRPEPRSGDDRWPSGR